RLELIHHPGSGQSSDGPGRHSLTQLAAVTSDDSHMLYSHHAHADVPLDVWKHSDHPGPGDRQGRAADNFPQHMIGLLPAADAEGINTYVESHRYWPPLKNGSRRRSPPSISATSDSTISIATGTAASTGSLNPIRPSSGPKVSGSQPT